MRFAIAAISLVLTVAAAAGEARLLPIRRHGTITANITFGRAAVADLDGDGRREIVSCSNGTPFAFGAPGGTYGATWRAPFAGCTDVAAGDLDGDGGTDVAILDGTQLTVFDPRCLAGLTRTVTIPVEEYGESLALASGNVDADAAIELVVTTWNNTFVYDGLTFDLQWTSEGTGGNSLRVADVDGDARAEIIVNGETVAHVLDAVAQTTKWSYAGGFGVAWDTGNLDADAKMEIAFATSTATTRDMNILHGDTFALTSWPLEEPVSVLSIGDSDGNGTAEILTGRSQLSAVRGYAPNGTELWKMTGVWRPGFIRAADLDGDNKPEVVWSSSGGGYGPDTFVVGHAADPADVWRSTDLDGVFSSVVADLDGDGRREWVVSSRSTSNFAEPGRIEIFDLESGASKGTLPVEGSINGLVAGQLDDDLALEIAAFAGANPPVLVAWDGVTKELEFVSNSTDLNRLRLANIDADAVDELLVTTTASQIRVLDGASDTVQKTLQLDAPPVDFAVADMNGDQVPELIVATAKNIRIYDTTSWTLLGPGMTSALTITDIEATSGGGGVVAVFEAEQYYTHLKLLKGPALTPGWQCTSVTPARASFADIGGETWLMKANTSETSVYAASGTACPEPPDAAHGQIFEFTLTDVTGDSRPEMLSHGWEEATISLLGLESETRGDIDGDEVISIDDIDATVDYLFGTSGAMHPAGDANADERISVEDVFTLIHEELAPWTTAVTFL